LKKHEYDRFYNTHGECIQKGLGESYSILFDGELFKQDVVNAMEFILNLCVRRQIIKRSLKP